MSNSISNSQRYGYQDTSYQAAGAEAGLRKLSTDFYRLMNSLEQAREIRQMHKEDLSLMTDKLTLFLSLWLGGPRHYLETYGAANMPMAHKHLVINEPQRDAWLLCMDQAIDLQEFDQKFKEYLKAQFRFPAEMIRKTSANGTSNS